VGSRTGHEQHSPVFSLVKAVLGHRAVALTGFLALTALASFGLARLKLSSDPLTPMYPEGHPFRPAL
jgi:hypothetical protein